MTTSPLVVCISTLYSAGAVTRRTGALGGAPQAAGSMGKTAAVASRRVWRRVLIWRLSNSGLPRHQQTMARRFRRRFPFLVLLILSDLVSQRLALRTPIRHAP